MGKILLKLVCLPLVLMALIYGVHKVYADDGTASAEVLSDVITVTVTQSVNMGSFYAPTTGHEFFTLRADGTISPINNVSNGYSHRGGAAVGRISIAGIPNAEVNVTTSAHPASSFSTMAGPSNKLLYRFLGKDVSSAANPVHSFNVALDNDGNGSAIITGFMLVWDNPTPGSYSLTFPVDVTYQ